MTEYTSTNADLNNRVQQARKIYRNGNGANDPDDTVQDLGEWDYGERNIDAATIQPRLWVLGNWWCREFTSSLISAGAGGKTAFRIACAIAVAANRGDIVGETVFERVPVLFVCFEDGETELIRRIAAAMKYHNVSNAAVAGYLWVKALPKLKFAESNGYEFTSGPLYESLKAAILRRKAGVVILDPLIKTHSVDENSNSQMDRIADILADLTLIPQTNDLTLKVAVDTAHHVRKGSLEPGDPEAGRGASASKDAGRLGYTLCRMEAEDAAAFGLNSTDRKNYFRIDAAKVNLVPPDQAKWFRLVSVPLGNSSDPRYPNGDNVQTVEAWKPPSAFADLPKTVIAEIFNAYRTPPREGEMWRPDSRANALWAGTPICFIANKTKGEARRILKGWIENGVLIPTTYSSPSRKDTLDGLRLDELKAAEITQSVTPQPTDE